MHLNRRHRHQPIDGNIKMALKTNSEWQTGTIFIHNLASRRARWLQLMLCWSFLLLFVHFYLCSSIGASGIGSPYRTTRRPFTIRQRPAQIFSRCAFRLPQHNLIFSFGMGYQVQSCLKGCLLYNSIPLHDLLLNTNKESSPLRGEFLPELPNYSVLNRFGSLCFTIKYIYGARHTDRSFS